MLQLRQGLVTRRLEPVDAQIDRGARRQRPPLLRGGLAENVGESRRQPLRVIAEHVIRRIGEPAVLKRPSLLGRQNRRRMVLPAEKPVDFRQTLPA